MKVVYVLRNAGIASRTPIGWQSAVITAEDGGGYSKDALRELADTDVVVVGDGPIGKDVFEAAPRLKLVQRLGVGVDNVDLSEAARRDIFVCNMPHLNAGTVAEHVVMMILALQRRAFESTLLMKAGRWPITTVAGRGLFDLHGKTVGILGLGEIGRVVADRLAGFGVDLLYHDAQRHPAAEQELSIRYVELAELLSQSDVVTCHVPLTSNTRGLLGRAELERMKPTALLINTARGAVVDEEALAEALRAGRIAGAGIDVFAEEPPPQDHPLRRCENVLLTPHSGGQTREAMERMVASMLENLQCIAAGKRPCRIVSGASSASPFGNS